MVRPPGLEPGSPALVLDKRFELLFYLYFKKFLLPVVDNYILQLGQTQRKFSNLSSLLQPLI